jgi:hypothetical protein
MKTNVGLWIDNKNAVIVFVSDKKIEEIIVKPNNNRFRRSLTGDGVIKRLENNKYPVNKREPYDPNRFYRDVMKAIRKAGSIFIMGNGEAEALIFEELVRNNLSDRVTGIETTGKLMISKLANKVQDYFLKHRTLGKCA